METKVQPSVSLAEVLLPNIEAIPVDPAATYKISGVYSWGRGLMVREALSGTQTTYKVLHKLHTDDLVLSHLKGWEGAIARVTPEFDGWFLSPQFSTFKVIASKLDITYLEWYCKQRQVWNELKNRSHGIGARRDSVSTAKFLSLEIPLPPLAEQRRIVTRIEELAAQIEQAKELRRQAREELTRLLSAEELKIWPIESLQNAKTLEEVTRFLARGRQSQQGESNHYLIKTQHVQDGYYIKSNMTLDNSVASKVSQDGIAQLGDILIACSAAGCLGRVAKFDLPGQVASTDTHVAIARADATIIDPEYLYKYLHGAQGQYQLRSRERGDWQREKVGFRLTELNLADLKQVPVPVPPLDEQRRIVAYLDELQAKVAKIRELQERTQAELDALLPALLDRAFKGELVAEQEDSEQVLIDFDVQRRRRATAAVIVNEKYEDETFHRATFQKLIYISDVVAGIDLHGRYERRAAGPLDRSIENLDIQGAGEGWLIMVEEKPSGLYGKVSYKPGPEMPTLLKDAEKVLGDKLPILKSLLKRLSGLKAGELELVATLYGSWSTFLLDGHQPTDEELIDDVLEVWHPNKAIKHGEREEWQESLNWMKANDFVPSLQDRLVRVHHDKIKPTAKTIKAEV